MPANRSFDLRRSGNTIVLRGTFGIEDYRRLLSGIHVAIGKAGYQDLFLDFMDCAAAFARPMLALCADVARRSREDVDFDLATKLEGCFKNCWNEAADVPVPPKKDG